MILLIHIISTSIMVGVIWTIQLVHYPSFNFINQKDYIKFQNFHMNQISLIVMPIMGIELFTGLIIIFLEIKNGLMFHFSISILFLIWLITGIIFSRLHQKLTMGYQPLIINKLIKMNWLRTFLWTFRLFLLII
tara:strand:+ start:812 stop:1213 length:402 start_codon:yes stop_codon:yes gene_type:complete